MLRNVLAVPRIREIPSMEFAIARDLLTYGILGIYQGKKFTQLIFTARDSDIFVEYTPLFSEYTRIADTLVNHIAKSLDLSPSAKHEVARKVKKAFQEPRTPIIYASNAYVLAEPGFDLRYSRALRNLSNLYFLHAYTHDGYLIFTDGFNRQIRFKLRR